LGDFGYSKLLTNLLEDKHPSHQLFSKIDPSALDPWAQGEALKNL